MVVHNEFTGNSFDFRDFLLFFVILSEFRQILDAIILWMEINRLRQERLTASN